MQRKTKQTPLFVVLILVGLLAWSPGSALAQDDADSPTRTVTVSGQGEVEARPDMAFINLSVVTEAEEASAALSQNNQQIQAVIDTLIESGIAEEEIETQSVQLDPIFAQPDAIEPAPSSPQQEITGYRATNTIQIRVTDLSNLGAVIDTAVDAGANQVQGIYFEVSNPSDLLDQARMNAWQDALRKAQQLAELAGASLGPVLDIQATDQGPIPFAQAEFAAADTAVPIRPGTQTLSTSLQVTWRLQANGDQMDGNEQTTTPGDTTAPTELIDQVVERLSSEIDVAADAIEIATTESVEWPDTSLGCPQPDQAYAQVITPGYRIILEAEGEQYEFHTSTLPDAQIVRCDNGATE